MPIAIRFLLTLSALCCAVSLQAQQAEPLFGQGIDDWTLENGRAESFMLDGRRAAREWPGGISRAGAQ